MEELFVEAIELCGGSESSLARACDVSQNAIWAARKAGRVSAALAIKIEAATEKAVPRWRLRPDLWEVPVSIGGRVPEPAAVRA